MAHPGACVCACVYRCVAPPTTKTSPLAFVVVVVGLTVYDLCVGSHCTQLDAGTAGMIYSIELVVVVFVYM